MNRRHRWLQHPVSLVLQHLGFWALSFVVFLHLFQTGEKAEKIDYIYTALFHASIAPAVYLNLKVLLPRFGQNNRWLLYIPAVVLLIALFSFINYSFFEHWSNRILPGYFFISYYSEWQVALFFVVYLALTSLLKLSKSWFVVSELQRELLESEKQKAQIELTALKAQINPHFFFNTLNNIYSMTLDKDERLPATVLQLSDLMRYFLYESNRDFVSLEKELKVLQDYIALQKIRSNEQLTINMEIEGDPDGHAIAPLLLVTLLENAFKHGAKGSPGKTFIHVFIQIQPTQINFRIENNKKTDDEITDNEYKGVGLKNVKRQLELLYPGKHALILDNRSDRFVVYLQIHA